MGLGVAAVLLTGCTGDGDDDTSPPGTEAATSPGTEAEPPDEPAGDDAGEDVGEASDEDGGEAAAPAPSAAGPVLASAEHPLTEQDGSLDIELRAAEVGDLLRVEVTFTPRGIGSERATIAELFGTIGGGNGMSARLIDPVNLLEYETVRPAVPHGQSTPAFEDQPTTLNFYFGAPVEPLETFDFLLDFVVGVPDWPGFVDVPLATG
jgi:hypothetical protein